MNKMFLGKLGMCFIAVFMDFTVYGIIVSIAIGHLIDHFMPVFQYKISAKLLRKLVYQDISEKFIFLLAYFVYFLNLDVKQSFFVIKHDCIIKKKEEKTVRDLFYFYVEDYIYNILTVKQSEKLKNELFTEVDNAIKIVGKTKSDKMNFFQLIEKMFNVSYEDPTQEEINNLIRVGSLLKINYVRSESEVKEDYVYEHKDENEKPNFLPNNILEAFQTIGINQKEIDFTSLKTVKRKYKEEVRKCHPDFIKSDTLSLKEQKNLNERLKKLNKSMDLVKKYLDNV